VFKLVGLDHVALSVRDVERSAAWYMDVLGLERAYEEEFGDVPAFVGTGDTWLALFPVGASEPQPQPGGDTLSMLHVAFRASRADFDQARLDLRKRRIPFEFEDHEVSHSIYFRDPDGHELEITTYEF